MGKPLPRCDDQPNDVGAALALGGHSSLFTPSPALPHARGRVGWGLLTHDLCDDFPVARTDVKVYVDDLLPGAQRERPIHKGDGERGTQK